MQFPRDFYGGFKCFLSISLYICMLISFPRSLLRWSPWIMVQSDLLTYFLILSQSNLQSIHELCESQDSHLKTRYSSSCLLLFHSHYYVFQFFILVQVKSEIVLGSRLTLFHSECFVCLEECPNLLYLVCLNLLTFSIYILASNEALHSMWLSCKMTQIKELHVMKSLGLFPLIAFYLWQN